MIRKIWQTILKLWRKIFPQPKPPIPPRPTPIRSFGEYEQKFMELLEGVEQGWSRGTIQGFLIASNIKDAEWENWLQEFGERLLVSPETNLELGRRMVRLGATNCGRISEVAGRIGRELLAGESLNLSAADGERMSDNVSGLLGSESLSVSTDILSVAYEGGSTSQSEYIAIEISKEAEELLKQGVDWYGLGYFENALSCYDKVIEINPEFHEAWINRSKVLDQLGRYQEATTNYYTAIALQSGNEKVFSIAREINKEAKELYNQGVKRYDARDLEGAIAAFEKALKIDPKYHCAWSGLGNALGNLGRNSEAIAAYETALEIDSKDNYAWNGLGGTLNDLGRNSEAITAFEKALEIDPEFHITWNGLGHALRDFGCYSKAIAAYKKALEIDPKFHPAWNNLGSVLNDFGRYSEAISAFDKALEITGDQLLQAWENRGLVFFNSGRYSKAIQNWDEGLQKYQPSNHDYREACGNLHKQKGKAHYEHGKETATYFESFHKAKASYEQAREFLKSPLIPETYLEVMQGLITVCRSLGDPKTSEYLTEATTVLENLLLDNQTHPEIKQRLQRKFAGLYQLEVDTLVEFGKKINALEKAEARKNFCLQWMRADSPNRTDSPTYPQIRDLLANNTSTAIIYWHLSPVSLTAFIITPDKFETITTPVTDLFPNSKNPSLENWLKDWKTNYQSYSQLSKEQSKESHPWRQSMTAQLQILADILKIPQICTHLTNIQHLILIPHRDLHLLPLDALFQPPWVGTGAGMTGAGTGAPPLHNPGRGNPPVVAPSGRGNPPVVAPIIRTISRLPSAQIAILQQQQQPTETVPNSLLMVEHSQGKSALKYTEIEAAAISQFYATQRPANISTKTAITEALKANKGIFHYTGHAYHNTAKSEASALILAGGEELTLTDILQLNFVNYYLICLSACETGYTKTGELIDEFVGIASGFLPETNYIISTLWRVDERSSALLMIYFYQLLQQGIEPPAALQQAKDWLRQLTNAKLSEWYTTELLPLLEKANFKNIYYFEREASRLKKKSAKIEEKPYEHPYHWAAFTITGNG
ncbi:CHAT domain-containing tetratricopeptide repeat protein [Microcoleus sp. A2-C5]|uniref:CHAT domain-containing tetratricopeptide repeat protein n=1 Tax=unclassified Microcoleus TaxID=2642155 RepID=UPI002FD00E2E